LEIKKNIKRTFKSRYGGKVKLLKKWKKIKAFPVTGRGVVRDVEDPTLSR
jgi:hypothetical protein